MATAAEHANEASSSVCCSSASWNDIPTHIQEVILRQVEGDEVIQLRLVCKAWSEMLSSLHWRAPWSGLDLVSTQELLVLKPPDLNAEVSTQCKQLPITCLLTRVKAGHEYTLHVQWTAWEQTVTGPMVLRARRLGMYKMRIYIVDEAGEPKLAICDLVGNMTGSKYVVEYCDGFWPCAKHLPSHPRRIALIKYCSGFFRPRKLVVNLPKAACLRSAQQHRHLTYQAASSTSARARKRAVRWNSVSPLHKGPTMAQRNVLDSPRRITSVIYAGGHETTSDAPFESQDEPGDTLDDDKMPACNQRSLCNAEPHWHEGEHQWCLNFDGRVTVPSIKNFQLVQQVPDKQRSDGVVFQFGKTGNDSFSLDYDPTELTALQSFCVALTSFDPKMWLA